MMEPKKVIAIFFVLALVALAIGGGCIWYQSQQGPDGHYNYSGERADTFETKSGYVIPALRDGYQWYIVEITLKNDRFDPGLKTEEIAWKLTMDGEEINLNVPATAANKDFQKMTVEKGKTVKYTVVFEVPENTLGKKTSMDYFYASTSKNPKLSYDSDLKLTATQISSNCIARCCA